jgi:two-component sensor histidine kinase
MNDSIYVPECNDSLRAFTKQGKKLFNQIGFDKQNKMWLGTVLSMCTTSEKENHSKLHLMHNYQDTVNTVIQVVKPGVAIMSKNRLEKPAQNHKENGSIVYADGYGLICQIVFGDGSSKTVTAKRTTNARSIPTGEATELEDGSVIFSMYNICYLVKKDGSVTSFEFEYLITHLSVDRLGNLWIGTGDGLYRYSNGLPSDVPQVYLKGESITGVILNHENGLWIATNSSGLFYAPSIYHTYFQEEESKPNSDATRTFVYNNQIFGITIEKGLYMIDSFNKMTFIDLPQELTPFDALKLKNKTYAVGVGLYEADDSLQPIKVISNQVFVSATYDFDSTILLLTSSAVFRFNGDSLVEIAKTPSGRTSSIAVADHQIWIGTFSGLYILSGGQVKNVSGQILSGDTISKVKRLSVDPQGNLYIVQYAKGIIINHHSKWFRVDSNQVVGLNAAHRIWVDEGGTIWASTSTGFIVFKYDFDKEEPYDSYSITWENGICGTSLTYTLSNSTHIYCSTANGVSIIQKHPDNYNHNSSPVYLHHIEVNNQKWQGDSIRPFEYDQNNFRFFVDVLNYQAMGKPQFKYKLIGFDSLFQNTTEPSVYYTNLPSGEYTLQIISINNNRVESKPLEYHFRILPPYWKTWWFISLVVLLGLTLVSLFFRYRVKKVRKEEEEKSQLNYQLASHQMTALRAQMNPHFTFNAINSIQRFILRNDQEQAYDYLSRFSRLIRQVLNNSKEELITIEEELNSLKLYVELEQLRFEHSFDFELNMDKAIVPDDMQLPCMLIQPFVENAIWHGLMSVGETRRGKITLSFKKENEDLLICIQDNGAGRNSENKPNHGQVSMGLQIARNRLSLYDQQRKTKLASQILFTDLTNEKGEPAGTIVCVQISDYFKD